MSSQNMCLFKRTIRTDYGKAQLKRLRRGSLSIIEDLITVRNVFSYCVEGPNFDRSSKGACKLFLQLLRDKASSIDGGLLVGRKGSDSEETLSNSVEMEDALGLRTRLLAVHKKHRIGTGAINMIVEWSRSDSTYPGYLFLHNLLTKAITVSLGVKENVDRVQARYKELVALRERDHEQFLEMRG
ncbi:hypothetical protein GOBAR_AA31498 [Gossypium barbadense]|uniref:Uncharacterized protein n=1 Tax=Gossypium barbadense TaxID=3634 RepID=A0A2P5WDM3_GOSBA|nr:hypothetical protein GOBAR_AA31498 [Gossypium barbadense]